MDSLLLETKWDSSKVTKVKSADGIIIPVPKGFTASKATGETEVNKGFVIYQGEETVTDENLETAKTSRNQFVWIPVNKESLDEMYIEKEATLCQSDLGEEITTTYVYSRLRIRDGDDYTSNSPGHSELPDVREPDILTDTNDGDASVTSSNKGISLIKNTFNYTETESSEILKHFAQDMVNEYTSVFDSIKKYGGFYIGRYETTGTVEEPTVKKGKTVLATYNTQAQNWYKFKNACSKIVSTDNVQSIMIYGNQYDEVMNWLINTGAKSESEININSSTWGNYNDYNTANGYKEGDTKYIDVAGQPQVSGFSEYWKANNIYDLAGNYFEWTQEGFDTAGRGIRGRRLFTFRAILSSVRSCW